MAAAAGGGVPAAGVGRLGASAFRSIAVHGALRGVASGLEDSAGFALNEEEAVLVGVACGFGVVLRATGHGAAGLENQTRGVGEAFCATASRGDIEAGGAAYVFAKSSDGGADFALGLGSAVGGAKTNGGNARGERDVPLAFGVLVAGFDAGVAAETLDAAT